MSRRIRKHHTFLIALAVYNFVLFFPVAFMGRVVSPNDVFYNFEPWALYRPVDVGRVQNSLLNDPPTSYLTVVSLVKDGGAAFHWNPYIASGVPGYGSAAITTFSPFVLLPLLALPLTWFYTGVIFLKLNAALLFAYLWLREERLGKRGAAIGAVIVAGAGVYAVRWLWQITNATALYPALLWLVRRAFNGRRSSIALMALLGVAYAFAGFPAAMAYGVYIAAAYAVVLLAVHRRPRVLVAPLVAIVIAALIATPFLVPFAQLVRRSGYLEIRKEASVKTYFPASHARSFVEPDRLGSPAEKNWTGDRALGVMNNYVESTIYLGLLAIPLALLGIFYRRARSHWFWLAAAVVVVCAMFGVPGVREVIGRLPGFKYSALARVALLLPLPIGYLAGAGAARLTSWLRRHASWRVVAGWTLAVAAAFELGLFAGQFHPYLPPAAADVPSTPTIDFLRREPKPFRIAPMFIYLWPNTSELFRLEDVRSHFSSEAEYRRLLQRLDPTSWSGQSTVITFDSRSFGFDDPLAGMLGIRYYIENRAIDIIKWKTFGATLPGVKENGAVRFRPGAVLQRTVTINAEPYWAIELPMHIDAVSGKGAGLELTLLKNGAAVWRRLVTKADADVMNKMYVPVRPYARAGESVVVRVRSIGATGHLLRGENANAAETPLYYGRVTIPVVFERELPDGRLFRNLAEVPRFHAVSRLRKLNRDELLAARDVDFATEAVITDDPVMPPAVTATDAQVTLTRYAPGEQHMTTAASGAFFLASSEKLTPELAIEIDGKAVTPIEINGLFAGVPVPGDKHEVVFSRRIARGWWWVAILGAALWLLAVITDIRRRRPLSSRA
ncbi:MAG: hypothetical protein QOH21_832 [Acidobacteriota bacterium]|nr:hypothetical protein [Acidobacteriota bacterium]